MRLAPRTLRGGLLLLIASPLSVSVAEEDSLYMRCVNTAMTLCIGDKKLEGCPNPWMHYDSKMEAESEFYISRISENWTLMKPDETKLTLVNSDDQYFEFTFTTSQGDWGRLRIERLSGKTMELIGALEGEILAVKGKCEKVDRKF